MLSIYIYIDKCLIFFWFFRSVFFSFFASTISVLIHDREACPFLPSFFSSFLSSIPIYAFFPFSLSLVKDASLRSDPVIRSLWTAGLLTQCPRVRTSDRVVPSDRVVTTFSVTMTTHNNRKHNCYHYLVPALIGFVDVAVFGACFNWLYWCCCVWCLL